MAISHDQKKSEISRGIEMEISQCLTSARIYSNSKFILIFMGTL